MDESVLMRMKTALLRILLGAVALATLVIPTRAADFHKIADIPYAVADGHRLLLDLYLPESPAAPPPLVVYVHGGAWRSGSKNGMPLAKLVPMGFAVASVDYRLSPIARFPAQVHDIKAAIRFLRASSSEYGYDADRIAVAGASAGAHLAALVGVTNGDPQLEGTVGDYLDQSSDVAAIVSYYGASDLLTILQQSTPHGLGVRIPALQLLIGAQPDEAARIAKQASPVFNVDKGDPPLFLLHGDQDPQMPINQSHELCGKYEALGLPVHFEVVHGAAHGGAAFYDETRTAMVAAFLRDSLLGGTSDGPQKLVDSVQSPR